MATKQDTAADHALDCMAVASNVVTRGIADQHAQGHCSQNMPFIAAYITGIFAGARKSSKFLKCFVASACFHCGRFSKTCRYMTAVVAQVVSTIWATTVKCYLRWQETGPYPNWHYSSLKDPMKTFGNGCLHPEFLESCSCLAG